MTELITKFFENNTVALVIAYVIAFNLFLSGLKVALEEIKDKTSNTVDNKLFSVVSSITGFLTKVIDWIGANTKH